MDGLCLEWRGVGRGGWRLERGWDTFRRLLSAKSLNSWICEYSRQGQTGREYSVPKTVRARLSRPCSRFWEHEIPVIGKKQSLSWYFAGFCVLVLKVYEVTVYCTAVLLEVKALQKIMQATKCQFKLLCVETPLHRRYVSTVESMFG